MRRKRNLRSPNHEGLEILYKLIVGVRPVLVPENKVINTCPPPLQNRALLSLGTTPTNNNNNRNTINIVYPFPAVENTALLHNKHYFKLTSTPSVRDRSRCLICL